MILLKIGVEDDIWEGEDFRNLLTNIVDFVIVILFNRMLREEPKPLMRGLVDGFHKGISQPALVVPKPVLVEENPEHPIFDVCGNRICLYTKERRRSIIHALWERTGKTHTSSGFVDGESKFCIGNRVLEVIFAKVTITVDVTLQGRDKAVNVSTRVRCLSTCEPRKGRKEAFSRGIRTHPERVEPAWFISAFCAYAQTALTLILIFTGKPSRPEISVS